MNIEKRRILASSEIPQVSGEFDNPQAIEICFTKGFYSIPDNDDEALIINAFKDPRHKAVVGIVENGTFGLSIGDRLIITDGAAILLKKDGTIRIDATAKISVNSDTDVEVNAPTVNIKGTTVNVEATNINMIGSFKITGTGKLNGSDIATV
jgi:phage gp45-like